MAKKYKFGKGSYLVMNSKGAEAILKGESTQGMLQEYTDGAAHIASEGLPDNAEPYNADVQVGKSRARGLVGTTDYLNRKHTYDTNALLRGLQ